MTLTAHSAAGENGKNFPVMRPMKTAWFAGEYFMDSLDPALLDTVHCGPPEMPLTWDEVVHQAGFEPELLVYGDMSLPPPFVGIERFPCLTVFLCVDSHIHSWYPYYAQAFDLCSVSLKDHIPDFFTGRLSAERIKWLPPFAKNDDLPRNMKKDIDLLFVGNVDPEVSPLRSAMLEELGNLIPGLVVMQGDYRTLFPRAEMVLNIAERGDLNYRVFEALGCGACLITPEIGHGQDELFHNRKDLFTYPLNQVESPAKLVRELLPLRELREKTAHSGFKKVDTAHRARHRAREFSDWVCGFDPEKLVSERLSMARHIHESSLKLLYLHQAEAMPEGPHRERYLAAATVRPLKKCNLLRQR